QYLSDLHEMFDDWTLALAAYNCGPGRVQRAIKKANSRNFWKVRQYLPRETREYIPRFIAANYLMNYYKAHGLKPKRASDELVNTESTEVYNELKFKDISSLTGIELGVVKQLNPAYIRHYIPKSNEGFTLTLPKEHMDEFKAERRQRMLVKEIERLRAKSIRKMLLPKSDLPEKIREKFHVPDILPPIIDPVVQIDNMQLWDIGTAHDPSGESKEAKKTLSNSKTRIKYVKLERTQVLNLNNVSKKEIYLSAFEYDVNEAISCVSDKIHFELIIS
ncbi:MAG: transglycosylase SLT domain-containing protein, partial [Melioribacteraceae bacterium]|nr:transglycosylase SLT domain-containing protein [Melioribacteraceae bacterium]